MKRVVVTTMLAFAAVAGGQEPAQSNQPAQTPGNAPSNQKVIKDPAEYNAYITALNLQDSAARAAAMDAFAKQYPQSVVLTDALEQAMTAYQKSGNTEKVEELAKRILQVTPNNSECG